jgi:molybdopterin synthase sulfur carrier subunit
MPVLVRIPAPLRKLAGDADEVRIEASTLGELISKLDGEYPGFAERILDESGQIHRFVNIYVNDDDVRILGGCEAPLRDGDEVSIVPAIAGG